MIRDRIVKLRGVPARELAANPRNWRRHPDAQAKAIPSLLSGVGPAGDRPLSKFSTAGTAVIPSGIKKVTVTLAGVTTTGFVLATVQGSGSFYVKNATAGSGKFTIYINKAPTAPATVTVASFVISAP